MELAISGAEAMLHCEGNYVTFGGLVSPPASHMLFMTQFQKFNTREPPKTKAELREMLAEAVRNTKLPDQKRPPKAKRKRD